MADTSRNIGGGGGGEIFNMYAFGVGLKYANLSNIMLGISNSFFENTNSSFQNTNSSFENTNSTPLVTITLYAYILVCFLVPLAPKQHKL